MKNNFQDQYQTITSLSSFLLISGTVAFSLHNQPESINTASRTPGLLRIDFKKFMGLGVWVKATNPASKMAVNKKATGDTDRFVCIICLVFNTIYQLIRMFKTMINHGAILKLFMLIGS